MSELQRYTVGMVGVRTCGHAGPGLIESEDGDVVKYEDVKELQAENKVLNNTISVIIEAVTSKDWKKACAIIEVIGRGGALPCPTCSGKGEVLGFPQKQKCPDCNE